MDEEKNKIWVGWIINWSLFLKINDSFQTKFQIINWFNILNVRISFCHLLKKIVDRSKLESAAAHFHNIMTFHRLNKQQWVNQQISWTLKLYFRSTTGHVTYHLHVLFAGMDGWMGVGGDRTCGDSHLCSPLFEPNQNLNEEPKMEDGGQHIQQTHSLKLNHHQERFGGSNIVFYRPLWAFFIICTPFSLHAVWSAYKQTRGEHCNNLYLVRGVQRPDTAQNKVDLKRSAASPDVFLQYALLWEKSISVGYAVLLACSLDLSLSASATAL